MHKHLIGGDSAINFRDLGGKTGAIEDAERGSFCVLGLRQVETYNKMRGHYS